MGLRPFVVLLYLLTPHCSADPKGVFANQFGTNQSGSKDSENHIVVQKGGDASHNGEESGNGRPKSSGPDEGGQAGDESGKEPNKEKLPEVYIDSDQALVPIASLTSDMEIDRGGYTFISQPAGSVVVENKKANANGTDMAGAGGGNGQDLANLSLTCTPYVSQAGARDALRVIQCDLDAASPSNRISFFPSDQVSWSFKISDCPKVQIVGNVVMSPECSPQEAATCSYLRPALRLNMANVDAEPCLLTGATLIFTIRGKPSKSAGNSANPPRGPVYKHILMLVKP